MENAENLEHVEKTENKFLSGMKWGFAGGSLVGIGAETGLMILIWNKFGEKIKKYIVGDVLATHIMPKKD